MGAPVMGRILFHIFSCNLWIRFVASYSELVFTICWARKWISNQGAQMGVSNLFFFVFYFLFSLCKRQSGGLTNKTELTCTIETAVDLTNFVIV